jgi:hypothetical protein
MIDLILLFIFFILMVWRTALNARDYYYVLSHCNDYDLIRLASDAFLFSLIVCSLFMYLFINNLINLF